MARAGVFALGPGITGHERRGLQHRVRACPVGVPCRQSTSCDIVLKAVPKATGARSAALVIGNDTFRGPAHHSADRNGRHASVGGGWGRRITGPKLRMERGAVPCADGDHRRDIPAMRPIRPTGSPERGSTTTDRMPASTMSARATRARRSRRPSASTHRPSTAPAAPSLRAASYVYATWVSTTRWIAYQPTAPRVLYLRRGSESRIEHWLGHHQAAHLADRSRRLPHGRCRGRERLRRVHRQWLRVGQGQGSAAIVPRPGPRRRSERPVWSTTSGKLRHPAHRRQREHGRRLMAGNANGSVKARVSTDAGVTWGPNTGLSASSTDVPAVAALGTRAAVAWTNGSNGHHSHLDGGHVVDAEVDRHTHGRDIHPFVWSSGRPQWRRGCGPGRGAAA